MNAEVKVLLLGAFIGAAAGWLMAGKMAAKVGA